eukprot:6212541-Pleurochrysis_carterae.AAC.2
MHNNKAENCDVNHTKDTYQSLYLLQQNTSVTESSAGPRMQRCGLTLEQEGRNEIESSVANIVLSTIQKVTVENELRSLPSCAWLRASGEDLSGTMPATGEGGSDNHTRERRAVARPPHCSTGV